MRVVDVRHLRHRPARVRRRADRDARRAAPADRRAEPADPRARVRGRRRRDRRRRDARRRGRPRRDHAARLLRPLRATAGAGCSICARRWPASGSPTPGAGWRELATVAEYQVVRLPDGVTYRQGALIEPTAVAAYGVERAGVAPGRPGAGHRGRADRRARRALRALRRRVRRSTSPSRTRRAARGPRRSASPRCSTRRSIDVPEFLREQSDGLGVDVAIECSGHPQRLRRRRSARCAGAARSRRRACSSARRPSSRCSGR